MIEITGRLCRIPVILLKESVPCDGTLAVCVNGALLGMHYKVEKGAVQTLENLRRMYDLATLIPAVLFGLMALLLFLSYPLTRHKVQELQILKEQKLKESYENKLIDI